MDRDRASIWGCTDCPARLYVEIATNPEFTDVRTVRGPGALSVTDYTAKVDLEGLPRGEQIYYRVIFERLTDANSYMAIIGSSFAHGSCLCLVFDPILRRSYPKLADRPEPRCDRRMPHWIVSIASKSSS